MIGRLANLVALGLLLATLAAWAVLLRPQELGGPALYVVVRGNSMLPVYDTGDLLVVRAAERYAIGDIVAYRVPAGQLGEGLVVVHRIVGGDAAQGFVTKGDHNSAPDPWSPRGGDIAGKPWLLAPQLGRLIAWLQQPVVAGALAASLVISWLLARRPEPRPPVGAQI